MSRRGFATISRIGKGHVFPALATKEQLAKFLRTPTGNVRDMIPEIKPVVDSQLVRKMLRMSGLQSDISHEMEQKWINALDTQIAFINQLKHSPGDEEGEHKTNAEVFRLIASDHSAPQPIDLDQLMQLVKENEQDTGDDMFQDFGKYIRNKVQVK